MIRSFLLLLTWLTLNQATAQDCQPMTLAKLRAIYQAADRSSSLITEGFYLPVLKADYSILYHRCRRPVGDPGLTQPVTLPELVTDSPRRRTICFVTYDRTTYLGIQANVQQAYQVLTSLGSQATIYSQGYTDRKTAYLFDSVSVQDIQGAIQFRIALMPLSRLR